MMLILMLIMMLKFCGKESSKQSRLVFKILGLKGFPLQPGWGGAPPISQEVTKSPPIRVPPPPHLQIFTFTKFLHYYYLKLEIKV